MPKASTLEKESFSENIYTNEKQSLDVDQEHYRTISTSGVVDPFPEEKTKSLISLESTIDYPEMGFSADDLININRAITKKSIIPEEKESLIEEHNRLITKKFKENLTKKEETRLRMVRWQLDRIDDAEHGKGFDMLEKMTEQRKIFGLQLKNFIDELKNVK